MHDPVLLSRIKSASYQLMQQFDFLSTGSINTPTSDINIKSSIQPINYSTTDRTNSSVSTSSTSMSISTPADFCLSPLTPRQQKRQLRASTFKARKTTASFETSISRDSKRPLPPKPADPRYNNFFKYLDLVDSGIIKLPNYCPISRSHVSTNSIPISNPSKVRDILSSLSITSVSPNRPPRPTLPTTVPKLSSVHFAEKNIRPCYASENTTQSCSRTPGKPLSFPVPVIQFPKFSKPLCTIRLSNFSSL